MKRVIVHVPERMKASRLNEVKASLQRQWDEGFMLVPNDYRIELVDQEWIELDEAYPEVNKQVLCYITINQNNRKEQAYAIGTYDGCVWNLLTESFDEIELLAWMPLPKPYWVVNA